MSENEPLQKLVGVVESSGGYMVDTVTVRFTSSELWLLQIVVRHEILGMAAWKNPPAGQALNDAICEAILFCEDTGATEAFLMLNWSDCLAIDFLVPSQAKDVNGVPVGRDILLKTYRARAELRRSVPSAEEGYIDRTGAQAKTWLDSRPKE